MKDNNRNMLGIFIRVLILFALGFIMFNVGFCTLESNNVEIMYQQEQSGDIFNKTQDTLRKLKQLK